MILEDNDLESGMRAGRVCAFEAQHLERDEVVAREWTGFISYQIFVLNQGAGGRGVVP